MNDKKCILNELDKFRDMLLQAHANTVERSDKLWNSLSEEDRLDLFLAVVRRIYKAEFVEKMSYRGALYETFGFGPEAYMLAQMDGYLDIHNACCSAKTQED